MEIKGEVKVLRIYISNTDKAEHTSLYEAIAFEAKRYGMAGATVYKGVMGYGASLELHSDKFWEITEKIPVIVEIIDQTEKIDSFSEHILPWIKSLSKGCLITSQKIDLILSKQGGKI
ncbi:MAG TPA: DUF190 domain-containing protein [Bacteroidales bacterium]